MNCRVIIIKLYKPYRSPLQAAFIIAFTAVFVLVGAATARYFPEYRLYLRLIGGVGLLVGAGVLLRFTAVEYVYALSDGEFSVRRRVGFTESTVFSLELNDKVKLYTKAELRGKKKPKTASYRQNLSAATAYIVYERGGKRLAAEIEPSAEFYYMIKAAIDNRSN